jgi:ABC-type lipoprotein release transport system permease subunit
LFEAALLGMLGATSGSLLGALLTMLVNAANMPVPFTVQVVLMRNTLHLVLEPRTLVAAIGGITLVTSAAALLPSLRAARRKVVDAMAHFG